MNFFEPWIPPGGHCELLRRPAKVLPPGPQKTDVVVGAGDYFCIVVLAALQLTGGLFIRRPLLSDGARRRNHLREFAVLLVQTGGVQVIGGLYLLLLETFGLQLSSPL